jgi:hypothetical protein
MTKLSLSTYTEIKLDNVDRIPLLNEKDFDSTVVELLDGGYRVKVIAEDYLYLYKDNTWRVLGYKVSSLNGIKLYLLTLDRVEAE